MGHAGNERADQCAKEGAMQLRLRVPDPPAMPKSFVNSEVETFGIKLWRILVQDLENMPDGYKCTQTRRFFPVGPRAAVAFTLLRLPRASFSHIVQFITGHNFLKRHEGVIAESVARRAGIDLTADKRCDFGCLGGDQSTLHLMTECDPFAHLRLRHFGTDTPSPPFMMGIAKVIAYLKDAKIKTLEIYETQKEYEESQQFHSSDESDQN